MGGFVYDGGCTLGMRKTRQAKRPTGQEKVCHKILYAYIVMGTYRV